MTKSSRLMAGDITFEWDDIKNAAIADKHGIEFEDATEAFGDPGSF